jgi:hypothetical protein
MFTSCFEGKNEKNHRETSGWDGRSMIYMVNVLCCFFEELNMFFFTWGIQNRRGLIEK